MATSLYFVSKLSNALLSFYTTPESESSLLKQVESMQDYLEKEPEVNSFFTEYGLTKNQKKEVIDLVNKSLGVDELFANTLLIMADRNALFHLNLFLSVIKGELQKHLNIKNIYIYSSFPIAKEQREKIETLWKERLKKTCNFFYAIDKSLKLGIKIQVDMYIEEYSLRSNLSNLKIKLDSIFG